MMPSIYIDLDDVVSESTRTYVDIIKQEFGRDVEYEQISIFDLKKSFGLTQTEFDRFFAKAHKADILLSFEPIGGAVDVIKCWKEMGYDICIVTGRLADTYDASYQWLAANDIPFNSLTMVDKYARLNMDNRNAVSLDQLAKRKYCLAIEDSPDMAHFLCHEMKTPVALYDRPWNRSMKTNSSISRFKSWKDIKAAFSMP